MKTLSICVLLFVLANSPSVARAQSFKEPGDLADGSGVGVRDETVLYPEMRFPIDTGPAFANSQVYNPGGMHGGGGSQCDGINYSYPWRDNFCEKRDQTTRTCPTGKGHQGQDIRPATCKADRHMAVAVSDGVIVNIGRFSVTMQSPSGTFYRYLHLNMDRLSVRLTQRVRRGQAIGLVSNHFGGTPTTIHLHFEIEDTVAVGGKRKRVYLPPYTSLVASYKRLLTGKP